MRVVNFFLRAIHILKRIVYSIIDFPRQLASAIVRSWNISCCLKKISQKNAGKSPIKVGFFVLSNLTENLWRPLYDVFAKDDRFDPYFVIVPYTYATREYMDATVENLKKRIISFGRNVIVADAQTIQDSVCTKDFFSGGLVFHTDPYTWLTNPESQMRNLTRSLIFYTPYAYCIVNKDNAFELKTLKCPFKILPETRLHLEYHKKYGVTKGRNLAPFLGYMGTHELLNKCDCYYSWKMPYEGMKKVILAPHHVLGLGNILRLHKFYIDLAFKYRSQISFVFKPHPFLKEDLKKYWSEEEIESYYALWKELPNTRLEEGDYLNLLKTSDAMILDSGSFNAEYSLLYKPLFFVEKQPRKKFNDIGERLFSVQYHGSTEGEIIEFVEKVVLGNHDILLKERTDFVNAYLKPPVEDIAQATYEYVLSTIRYSPRV